MIERNNNEKKSTYYYLYIFCGQNVLYSEIMKTCIFKTLKKNYMPGQKLKITFYNTVEMHVGEYDSKRNAGYKIM